MKNLSRRQRIVVGLIWVSVVAILLVRAIPSMALVLHSIAIVVVVAAAALEIEEYLSVREIRNKP